MGKINENASEIFCKADRFGLAEKHYRDLSEMQSSFKFMIAAAREFIYVDPANTTAAIATCGGIVPGVNCVIRALVKCLDKQYKVKNIIGVRMGMYGLMQREDEYWIPLKTEDVAGIQYKGGSMLGTDQV